MNHASMSREVTRQDVFAAYFTFRAPYHRASSLVIGEIALLWELFDKLCIWTSSEAFGASDAHAIPGQSESYRHDRSLDDRGTIFHLLFLPSLMVPVPSYGGCSFSFSQYNNWFLRSDSLSPPLTIRHQVFGVGPIPARFPQKAPPISDNASS